MRCCFMFASQFIGWAATLVLMVSRSCKHKQKRRRIKPKRCRFVACSGAAFVAPETMTVRLWSCFQRGEETLILLWHALASSFIILLYLVFLLFVNLNAWSYAMISLASNQSASSFSDVIKRRKVTLCLAMKVWEGEGSESQRLFSLCSQYSASFSCNSYSSCLLQFVWILTLWDDLFFFFFNGHFELRLKLGLLPIACSQTNFLECRRPQRSPYLSVFLIPSSCGMARITSYRSRLRFQRPRKGTLPTMKSRSERVEKDYRTQTTEQGGRKPKSSKICLCKDKVVIHTREHPK